VSPRAKNIAYNAALIAVWVFLVWFGLIAIDLARECNPAGIAPFIVYVLIASFVGVALIHRMWGPPYSN
jgi:hypothetical protein